MADLLLLRRDHGLEQGAVFCLPCLDASATFPPCGPCSMRWPAIFPTFAAAGAAVAGDEGGGHSNPDLDWRSETPRTLARPTIRCCFIFRVYCRKSEPCLTLPEALETLFIAIRNISTCQPA